MLHIVTQLDQFEEIGLHADMVITKCYNQGARFSIAQEGRPWPSNLVQENGKGSLAGSPATPLALRAQHSVDISAYTLNVSNLSFCAAALRTHSAPCLRWLGTSPNSRFALKNPSHVRSG